jgi:hemerythrin-like domain-containing protein
MKVTEGLAVEHTVYSKVFDQIERALPKLNTLEEAKMLSTFVEGLLQSHGDTEENLFYLTMDYVLEGKDQLGQLHHEHQEIDVRVKQAQSANNLEEARQLLTAAMRVTRDHFRHEEQVAFPLIERKLHYTALNEVGKAWMQDSSV